mgnify:FL=1
MLVAEDDPADRELIRRALRDRDHPVKIVHDGAAVVEYIAACFRPDAGRPVPGLVILDLNMPRLSGREVMMELGRSPITDSVPVVVFSSSDSDSDVRACYELGCRSYVVKPTDLQPFLTALNGIVSYWLDLVEETPLRSH